MTKEDREENVVLVGILCVAIAGVIATTLYSVHKPAPLLEVGQCVHYRGEKLIIVKVGKYSYQILNHLGNPEQYQHRAFSASDLTDCSFEETK